MFQFLDRRALPKVKKKKGTKSEEEKRPSACAGSIDLGFKVLDVRHSTTQMNKKCLDEKKQ